MNKTKISKIKLYSTSTCPFCIMEAFWLDKKGAKYEKVLVDQNQKEAIDIVRKTGQMGVPVTAVLYEGGEEEYIIGFDKSKLEQILNSQ